jgi:hypothetical protein
MNATVTAEQKLALTAAAMHAVGPMGDDRDAWRDTVADVLTEITRSALTGDFGHIIDQVATEKRLTGVITAIDHEAQSNRAVITLKVPESKFSPDGEKIRTDRLENPAAKELATHIKHNLIGHQVTVWKQTETNRRGTFTVLSKIVDHGWAAGEVA